ncbi:hypothetical protein B0T11DRAFT_353421 [Plectosphaerella cucumerina]|uniref:Uncharacterized protein n=1 Tax=Plectosphaerella cucumerina TaxID=40658 RepID=A0A8K0TH38_9PEZI|nr:hypothetical protein B0T11DRAFT_353421 [Plectosphaerella cucumerina]
MSSDPDDPSSDLPTTTIARRGPSQNGVPAVTIILEGQANPREATGRYVGVHAITLQPVFTTGSTFLLRPGGRQAAAKDIIFDEKLLRNDAPESAAALRATAVVIDEIFVPAQKRRQRFPARPGPVKRSRLDDVGTEAHHMELPLRLGHIDEYRQSEFFRLAVPRLGNIQIPETLVALARAIQASLHNENLHLHVVVMAIIVWVDIHSDPAERGRVRFPPQNLTQFVAYWPHFLRFHEVFHLPVYCHPCQFTRVMGQNNIYAVREDWEEEAKTLVDVCRLHPRTDYAQMLPSSWPGSTLTFPADAEDYGFATPNMVLAKKLGQPSIHIIGHPAYPCDGSRHTAFLLPRTWMSPAIKYAMPRTTTEISDIVIEPERRELGSLRLITGQVLDIFPRPEDLTPLATIPAQQSPTRPPCPVIQQQEVHNNVHTNNSLRVFWEHVASPEFRRAQKEAQDSKLQEAIAAGITLDQVSFDQHNLLSPPKYELP